MNFTDLGRNSYCFHNLIRYLSNIYIYPILIYNPDLRVEDLSEKVICQESWHDLPMIELKLF